LLPYFLSNFLWAKFCLRLLCCRLFTSPMCLMLFLKAEQGKSNLNFQIHGGSPLHTFQAGIISNVLLKHMFQMQLDCMLIQLKRFKYWWHLCVCKMLQGFHSGCNFQDIILCYFICVKLLILWLCSFHTENKRIRNQKHEKDIDSNYCPSKILLCKYDKSLRQKKIFHTAKD